MEDWTLVPSGRWRHEIIAARQKTVPVIQTTEVPGANAHRLRIIMVSCSRREWCSWHAAIELCQCLTSCGVSSPGNDELLGLEPAGSLETQEIDAARDLGASLVSPVPARRVPTRRLRM